MQKIFVYGSATNDRQGDATRMRCKMRHGTFIIVFILVIAFAWMPGEFAEGSTGTEASSQVSLSQPLTVRWQYESDQTVNLTPATDGERIYLPLAEGSMVSLRALDGQLFWRTEIGGELLAAPAADEDAGHIASKRVVGAAPFGQRARRGLHAPG